MAAVGVISKDGNCNAAINSICARETTTFCRRLALHLTLLNNRSEIQNTNERLPRERQVFEYFRVRIFKSNYSNKSQPYLQLCHDT